VKRAFLLGAFFILTSVVLNSVQATTLKCQGRDQILVVHFDGKISGLKNANYSFDTFDNQKTPVNVSGEMKVDVLLSAPGEVDMLHQVNSYSGSFQNGEDSVGFWLSQAFDLNGQFAFEYKNIFGMNRKALGTCNIISD